MTSGYHDGKGGGQARLAGTREAVTYLSMSSSPAEGGPPEGRAAEGRASTRRALVEQEIYEQATRLFAERGFAGTSFQDIADAVGLTRPALAVVVA